MQKDIVVSVPRTDRSFAAILEAEKSLDVTVLDGSGIDGGGELIVLLIPVATLTVNKLVELLKVHWEKAKHVKFEVDGMSITGASLSDISKFLDRSANRSLASRDDRDER